MCLIISVYFVYACLMEALSEQFEEDQNTLYVKIHVSTCVFVGIIC